MYPNKLGILPASLDPLKIVQGNTETGSDVFSGGGEEVFELLQLDNLFYLLRRDLFLAAACVVAVLMLKLMITHRPHESAEQKKDIFHKLWIVFLGASIISILNVLFTFFSLIFW